ncbi:phage-like minor tail protein, partial [Gottschalkia purinilytica]
MSDVGSLVVRVAMENSSFNQGVQNLQRSMRVIQSEFKNATAGLGEHGKGLEGLKAKQEMLSKSIDVQRDIVDKYKNKLKESKDTLDKNTESQVKLKEKVDQAKKAYEESKNTLGENAEETKKLKSKYEELSQEYTDNEEKLRSNVRTMENWETKTNNAEAKLKDLEGQLKNVSKELTVQENKWTQLSKKLEPIGKKFKDVGGKIEGVGKSLSMKLTAPLAGIGIAASKIGMDFEASMSQVQAFSGATASEMKQLEKAARDAGASTSKSAKDAADALGYMALAGWDSKTSMEALMPVLRLSEAGNIDLARASSLVTDSMSALGITTKDLPKYLDIVAQTARSSNTDIDQMAEAYLSVGGTLRGLKVPLEDSALALGFLANAGVKGSESGKALNAVLLNLTAPAGRAKKALDELKFTAFDSKGKFKGLEKVLFELKGKMQGMTEKQKNMYLSMIGGKEHVKDLNALLNGLDDTYDQLKGDISKFDGALMDVATTMQSNNKGSITALKSALEELGLKIYDSLKPSIASLVDFLQRLTDKFNSLSPKTQENIVKFGMLTAAIGPVTFGVGKLISGIGGGISTIASFAGWIGKTAGVAKGLGTAATVASGTAGVGGLAGLGTALGGAVVAAAPAALAIGAVAGAGYMVHKGLTQEAIPALDLFASQTELTTERVKLANGEVAEISKTVTHTISEETKKQVGAFMELSQQTGNTLTTMYSQQRQLTDKEVTGLTNKFGEMKDRIVQKYEENKDRTLQKLTETFNGMKSITAEEQKNIINMYTQHYDQQIKKTQEKEDKIKEILNKAKTQKEGLTQSQYNELLKLQRGYESEAIKLLSKNKVEQEVILNNLKNSKERINAEMMSDAVKKINKQKEETVKKAKEERDNRVRMAEEMKQQLGPKAEQTANKIIEEANRQYREVKKKAEQTKNEGIKKLEQAYGDLTNTVNTDTGKILTWWDKIKNWWNSWKPEKKKLEIETIQPTSGRMPQYARGTNSHPGGLAVVSEEGREGIVLPNGSFAISGNRGAELVNLPRGTKVIPNRETEKLLKGFGIPGYAKGIGNFNFKGLKGFNGTLNFKNMDSFIEALKEIDVISADSAKLIVKRYGDDIPKAISKTEEKFKYRQESFKRAWEEEEKVFNAQIEALENQKEHANDNMKKELENKIKSTRKQKDARKSQVDEEIKELDRLQKAYIDALKEEENARKQFVSNVNNTTN